SLVAVFERLFELFDGVLDGFLLGRLELVAVLFKRLARGVHQGVALVAGMGQFGNAVIVLGIGLGVFHHALDLFIGQAGVGLDGDLVFLAGALVFGRHVQDAVGVDVERDFDLRRSARGGRDAFKVELAQCLV